jgi:hypothetical protein
LTPLYIPFEFEDSRFSKLKGPSAIDYAPSSILKEIGRNEFPKFVRSVKIDFNLRVPSVWSVCDILRPVQVAESFEPVLEGKSDSVLEAGKSQRAMAKTELFDGSSELGTEIGRSTEIL